MKFTDALTYKPTVPINIQLFADDAGSGNGGTDGAGNDNGAGNGANNNQQNTGKTNNNNSGSNSDGGNQDPNNNHNNNAFSSEEFQKMLQREVDRATNKLGNENKSLRDQLDKLQKEKLSAEELEKLKAEEREKTLAEREKTILRKENEMFAIKTLKEVGLDDGSELALSFIDMVMDDEQDKIKDRVNTLKTAIDKMVKVQVDTIFKENGRTPGAGNDSNDKDDKSSVAKALGEERAKNNKKSQDVLSQYLS